MTTRRLVLASANPDKVAEIRALLAGVSGLELVDRPGHVPDVIEDAPTLAGNARLKATALADATGLAAVSDDTGLFVEALGGDPGVRTARYASEHATYADNVAKLLNALEGVEDRRARFVTVALVAFPGGQERWIEGVVRGTISEDARGGAGFGYDPVFVPDGGDGSTYAEMGLDAKNALSHRAVAFYALVPLLQLPWPRFG